ncbi:major facilitator superfamily domain-containing protein [Aspergillus filifer]
MPPTIGPYEATQMTWHVGGYSLTVGAFIPIAGKLGDLYGSKRIFVLGWAFFGILTIICGYSTFTQSPIFFNTARALQGVAPAFLLPNVLAITGRTYPPGRQKSMVFLAFALAAPLGCYSAGLGGAALAEYLWWPWFMWLYIIGCFILATASLWVVPSDSRPRRRPVGQSFDLIGFLIGVFRLLLFEIAWNQAPIDGWSTPYVYTLLFVGFLILGNPILDASILNRHVEAVLLITGLGWSSFGVWFYYLFQFIQQFRGVSPLEPAVQFTSGAISGIIAASATPYLMSVISSAWLMRSYWLNTFWSFVVTACGMDISFPASATILSDVVQLKHQGALASLVNTVINYEDPIGLGIAGTVESRVVLGGGTLFDRYRSALWTPVGLSGVAFAIALSTRRDV